MSDKREIIFRGERAGDGWKVRAHMAAGTRVNWDCTDSAMVALILMGVPTRYDEDVVMGLAEVVEGWGDRWNVGGDEIAAWVQHRASELATLAEMEG